MASKQLGKFKQWAGEKISSREKTVTADDNDDFKETEQDIDLRKEGLIRLHMAAEDYHHTLSKKKESPAVQENEKLMPIDTFGIVMLNHGEEFGDQSAFGSSLVKLGRAHCKVATLQESYAITFQDGFINSCKGFLQDIRDYEHQKKKLESRRLSYDAALNKLEKLKASKKEKEKDRKDAEDELQKSRLRYEETSEDVRARMQAIQENEVQQLRELTNFLDIQLNFARQYREIMQEVKEGWCDEAMLTNFERSRSRAGSQHTRRSVDDGSRFRSVRSKRSAVSMNNQGSSTDDDGPRKPHSRRPSESKTTMSSRPTSRASRKRSDSAATAGAAEKASKRMSVAGWASSAVSSVTGRGRKEGSNFAALKDKAGGDSDDDESDKEGSGTRPPSSRSMAKKSPMLSSSSPRVPPRRSKPPSPTGRVVKTLYDFSGTADELPFKAGEEIVVLSEPSEDWWLGQNASGRKGLFPTNYVESTSAPSSHMPRSSSGVPYPDDESEDDVGKYIGQKPVGVGAAEGASAYLNGFDSASAISSLADHNEEEHLVPFKGSDDDVHLPGRHDSPSGSYSGSGSSVSGQASGPGPGPGGLGASLSRLRAHSDMGTKRPAPPRPPPRKSTTNLLNAAPPLVPERRSPAPQGSSALLQPHPNGAALSAAGSRSSPGKDVSPFDSLMDISMQCTTFKQHPGEPIGFCGNCFRMH
ncbi:BAR-domain-containing protein [Coniophora puteana RWD-64-598 SS2]|uniref:BAR-domain-containing protein n=1 Tax=Coniophora puteana (strain RWD-64-598) TaxID=741705 RepID=A0A5M3M6Q0_CONPW|nr:BAR-domain-containing protein [Coniophora puteana RWD-64-598 SS2]EIW74787.1 BAR-domain-containing protein [Coniophora puteana RWD-64-598 SS2]